MAKSFRSRLMAGWMKFGRTLGDLQARILLAIIFYLVIFPLGVIWKLIGKDPMGKKFSPESNSYFVTSDPLREDHWDRMF